MTQPVQVPIAPPLCRLPSVELMHVGEWELSTGPASFTADDLSYAVAALDCPAVRRPVLKLGHTDPRFDGEPAVGYVDNLCSAEGGSTLLGDFAGMPGWLGPVLASAYPDRSVECVWDWPCQLGHIHPFVVLAVALLGVTRPGIGTLQSLQDVAALYGVAASTHPDGGTPVTVTVHAAQEAALPNPRPTQVTASVTTDDVRRAYYEIAPWSVWIEEIQLPQGSAPMTLLTIDDSDRTWHQVEVIIGDGDGEDAVTFADPVEMKRTFVPVADTTDAAASSARVVFASRAESRPGAAPTTPAAAPAPGPAAASSTTTPTEEPMSNTLLDGLRQQLGLAADADEATVLAANAEALTERAGDEPTGPAAPAAPTAPAAAPAAAGASPDVVPVDAGTFEQMRRDAAAGAAARAQQESEARAATVAAAVADGRIPPARREHWIGLLAADAGAADVLAGLKPGTVPVSEAGIAGEGDSENTSATAASVRETDAYKKWVTA